MISDPSNPVRLPSGGLDCCGDPHQRRSEVDAAARNVLRGPSFWMLDLGMAKNFRLPWEGHRIQLRMDAFNVFNRNRNVFGYLAVSLFTSPSSFGQISGSASTPREVQFAVRWDF